MRCLSLVALVALLGCGRPSAPTVANASPLADPTAARREDDAQAAYALDNALTAIQEALAETKRLAPTAGGDAKEALLDIAEMYDSAGATLADHNDPPPPLEEYRKAPAERASERSQAVTDALDALHELRDAQGTLDDLSQTVPAEHKAPLDAIQAQTDEAIDSVEGAIKRLGGKAPPDEEPGI